jgi:hypothetical protein
MKLISLLVGITLVALASAAAASWDDDSHYVSLGPRNGYYIVQPDSHLIRQLGLYEAPVIGRIGSLTRGRATTQDVEAMFGRTHSRADRPDGFMLYYALPVYNPFEDWGGGRR